MPLFAKTDRVTGQAIVDRAYCNPFLPERIDFEKRALGNSFLPTSPVVHFRAGQSVADAFPNLPRLLQRTTELVRQARESLAGQCRADAQDLRLHEDLALFQLYSTFMTPFEEEIAKSLRQPATQRIECWPEFAKEFHHLLQIPGVSLPSRYEPQHVFACFFQFHRAFSHIFEHIIGSSLAAANLRAAVWQSLFTHDMRRYARVLYRQMATMTTLITGPSGSGKELVARAVALSQYIAFDSRTQSFTSNHALSHHPINLSALPDTLIESELFGHKKGTFTGATADRTGWLESCGAGESVFLDEIGELATGLQVKLLRVLQDRKFQRLGESKERTFVGKIIAATNRDLAVEMRDGRFRDDLYYRLCSDVIRTPSLREQLAEAPGDLPILVRFIVGQILDDDPLEADELSDEINQWIEQNLGPDYEWPGNIRELEQCVRNVMIRRHYQPAGERLENSEADAKCRFLRDVERATLSADELISNYYAFVLKKTGSYQEAARRLGVDWRTVKNRL